MILTEVYIPAINKKYDFRLDENAYIADVIWEIGNMVFIKDNNKNIGLIENLILCDYSTKIVFSLQRTLKDYGVSSGTCLTLI